MNALTLYQAEERLQMLVDSEEMLTAEAESALLSECAAEIAEATDIARDKRDNVARFILALTAAIEAKNAEAARLREQAKAAEAKLKLLKTFVCESVKSFGVVAKGTKSPKLVGNVFTLMAKTNSQSALHVPSLEQAKERPDLCVYEGVNVRHELMMNICQVLDMGGYQALAQALNHACAQRPLAWDTARIKETIEAGTAIEGFSVVRGSHLEVK